MSRCSCTTKEADPMNPAQAWTFNPNLTWLCLFGHDSSETFEAWKWPKFSFNVKTLSFPLSLVHRDRRTNKPSKLNDKIGFFFLVQTDYMTKNKNKCFLSCRLCRKEHLLLARRWHSSFTRHVSYMYLNKGYTTDMLRRTGWQGNVYSYQRKKTLFPLWRNCPR